MINIVSNKKNILLSEYITTFKPFYLSRDLTTFTYSPVFYSIFNKKESINHFKKLIKKYLTSFSQDKGYINSFDIVNYDFNTFQKDKFYTFTFDKEYKDEVNYYIDISCFEESQIHLQQFVLSQFFLHLREKVSGFNVIIKEETLNKIFNVTIRTYSDFIFLDSYVNKIMENSGKLIASPYNFTVGFDFNNQLLCIDRTTNWIEFKIHNF